MHQCKNCSHTVTDKYCGHCGQKGSIERLSLHDLWHELWHAFTHTDSGILRLLKELVLRPRSVYGNYFRGQRKSYFSPVVFYLVTAGISIYIGDKIFDYEDHVNHMNNEFGRFALDHTKLLGLFLLPIEALLTWAFFYRRFNLAECFVFWLFCNGLVFVFNIVISPVYIPLINHKSLLDHWLRLLSFLIIYWQVLAVFAVKRTWKIYLGCFLFVNALMIIHQYAGYYLLFDNDAFKQPFLNILHDAYIYSH